ncbi:MAG: DUF1800 domain-containing protein [Steroidobacteraceae bacterium]
MARLSNSRMELIAATRLATRAGLGPDPLLAGRLTGSTAAQAIETLVVGARDRREAQTALPDWSGEPLPEPGATRDLSPEDRRQRARQIIARGLELQAWWLQEMLATPHPLTERMTLFWHGHFTSGLREVRVPQLPLRQNALLRRHALGDYRELLHAIVRDPAMLLYLDNQQNRRDAPNENFARELLELFTLGEGHYDENDVREAARAFTGWRMRPPEGRFTVAERQHDAGEKHFLGATGNFDGDDIVERILARPRAAEFIVEKLWREFVSPVPQPRQVQTLATEFRRDYRIAPLVASLLTRAAHQPASDAGQLVKSPVEFVVGTLRSLELPLPPRAAALACTQLGQTVFSPPNVRGWPGGEAWITTESLLARREFILALSGEPTVASEGDTVRNRVRDGVQRATARLGVKFDARAESLSSRWAEEHLLVRPPLLPAEPGATPSQRLQAALLDPVYHLR